MPLVDLAFIVFFFSSLLFIMSCRTPAVIIICSFFSCHSVVLYVLFHQKKKKSLYHPSKAEQHIEEEKKVFALTKLIYALRSLWPLFTTSCVQVYWLHIDPIDSYYYYSITTTNNRKIKIKELEPSGKLAAHFFFVFFPFQDITL